MAEAFLINANTSHMVSSAGTNVKEENENQPISNITEKVITCMEEVGIDVTDKRMNQLTKEMVDTADSVISIVPVETLPEYLQDLPKLEVWNIPDAGGTDLDFHRAVRDSVSQKVTELVSRLGV